MSNEDKKRIKIILLGEAGVGKTAIIERFSKNIFNDNENSTTLANFVEKQVVVKKQKLILELWDTVGQEEFRSITKIFVKNSKIIILVYDVTTLQTFESLEYWYDFISKELGSSVVFGLAGNKTDLIFEEGFEEQVSPEKGKEYAEKIGAKFALISAKESAKEIISLINDLVLKYLEDSDCDFDFDTELNSTIKLVENQNGVHENNNKKECCLGKNKKAIKLKMVFLGCKGVGKTSIIKAMKGNKDINDLEHTKKPYKEELDYIKQNQSIIVELKDTNGDEFENENLGYYVQHYNAIFFVFDIYKKDTFDKLDSSLKKLDTKKIKVYLIAYNNDTSEKKKSEFEYETEAEKLCNKYGCFYEYVSIEDVYKIKAIIIDNISNNLPKISK